MWDRLKGKKDEEAINREEEKRILEIQKMTDKVVETFKKDFGKDLQKLGLQEPTVELTGFPSPLIPSFIIAKFYDSEAQPVTLIQSLDLYTGSPPGGPLIGTLKKVYFGTAVWFSSVKGTIPFTLVHREISQGLFKGSQKLFVPFTNTTFGELKITDPSLLQIPLVAELNRNTELLNFIHSNCLTSSSVYLTHKATLNIGYNDLGGRCTIIPSNEETVIFFRDAKGDLGTYYNTNKMLWAISQVRKIVSAHATLDRVSGNVPSPIFNQLFSLANSSSSVQP